MTAGMALNGIPIHPYDADYFDQRKIKDLAKVPSVVEKNEPCSALQVLALIYTKET